MPNDCRTRNFKIYKATSISELLKLIKEALAMIKESILLTDVIKVSKSDFPEERDPSETLQDGSKSIVWIEAIHGEYTNIQLVFSLQSPDNPAGTFSFPANSVTIRVAQDPPGTVNPPGTIGGSTLKPGALLAQQSFNTPGFKTMNVTKPTADTLMYVGFTQDAGEPLLSTDRPKIVGMRMEFGL